MDTYAKRVRVLTHSEEDTIDPSALFQIMRMRPHSPLFPNLTDLVIDCDTGYILPLLSSPFLRAVEITTLSQPFFPAIWTFIQELQHKSPRLKWLSVTAVIPPRLISSLTALDELRFLSICYDEKHADNELLGVSLFTSFAGLPDLQTLEVQNCSSEKFFHSSNTSESDFHKMRFPVLKNLGLTCRWATLLACINSLKDSRLRSLTFYPARSKSNPNESHPTAEEWDTFVRLLQENTSNLFESIVIHPPHNTQPQSGNLARGFRHPEAYPNFRQVFTLWRSLSVLEINFPIFHSISQEDIESIVDAWPRLSRLHLASQATSPARLNFKALATIALKLPHLTSLRLSVQAANLPDIGEVPVFSHRLAHFEPYNPFKSDDPLAFAQCFDRLFPFLSTETSSRHRSSEPSGWVPVLKALRILQQARMDQQRRQEGKAHIELVEPGRQEEGRLAGLEYLAIQI